MTAIHNFYLQRCDGTTAAERLFGKKFPNLFEWIVSQMGELPTPRKPRKLPLDTTASLPAIPS
jgi:hypothetical protein